MLSIYQFHVRKLFFEEHNIPAKFCPVECALLTKNHLLPHHQETLGELVPTTLIPVEYKPFNTKDASFDSTDIS